MERREVCKCTVRSGNHSGMRSTPDKRIRVALDNGNASGERNFDVNDDDTEIESLSFNCNVQHSHDVWLDRQTDSRIVLQSANLLIWLG